MNAVVKETPSTLIESAKAKFTQIIAAENTGVHYEKESMFAFQALTKNDYVYKIAMNNKPAVINAVINIASVGLTLNPATSYAYLVPRDGAICLDISYQGLIKIATDSGSIMWAKADLVFEKDTFIYNGVSTAPTHQADPFDKERGEFKGVYCIAKTCDGDFLVETMSAEEIEKIKGESSTIKGVKESALRYSPWTRYFGEMTKKTCIKRASKTWPKTSRSERVQKAIEIVNEHEGSDWSDAPINTISGEPLDVERVSEATNYFIHQINMDEEAETVAPRIKEAFNRLTNDEQVAVNNKLKEHKFENRQLNTILRGFLEFTPSIEEEL
jgi:recombination protein RecT